MIVMDEHLKAHLKEHQRLETELGRLDMDMSKQPAMLQLLALEQEFERFIDAMRCKQDELKAQLAGTQKISRAVDAYENVMNLNSR